MARPGGNPDLKGKKGRSGRKSYRDEQLRIEVIEKAWLKKKKRMTESDATQFCLKDMTEKVKHSGEVKVKPLLGGKSNGSNNQSNKKTPKVKKKD